MSACRSCHARILWVESEGGKTMPLDAEMVTATPEAEGPFFELVTLGGRPIAYALGHQTQEGQEAYRSHFKTCPDREKWEKVGIGVEAA